LCGEYKWVVEKEKGGKVEGESANETGKRISTA